MRVADCPKSEHLFEERSNILAFHHQFCFEVGPSVIQLGRNTRLDGAEVAVVANFFLADDLSVALRFLIGAGSSFSDKSISEPGMAELLVSKK